MGFFDVLNFEGQHAVLPSLSEGLKAFADLGPGFWMRLIGGGLWLMILAISLRQIDRRDLFTGLVYMLFMMCAGVMLTIALPAKLLNGEHFTGAQLLTILVLLTASALRWHLRDRPVPQPVNATTSTQTPLNKDLP